MEWSHDFCLSCDRQLAEGPYCSQACRLADLEKAGTSEPCSPSTTTGSWASSSPLGSATGFYLPPAVNFSAFKSPTRLDSPPASPASPSSVHSSDTVRPLSLHMPSSPTASSSPTPRRTLTPSSSRSSLSSIRSTPSMQGLSDQARSELRDYLSCFDQTRDWKRRCTLS